MRPLSCLAVLPLLLTGCTFSPNVSITTAADRRCRRARLRDPRIAARHHPLRLQQRGEVFYYAVFTSDCHADSKDAKGKHLHHAPHRGFRAGPRRIEIADRPARRLPALRRAQRARGTVLRSSAGLNGARRLLRPIG